MRNLVQQFSMRPPDKQRLAARLLVDPRGVADVMPVARSTAPVAFYTGAAKGIITQPPKWYLGSGDGSTGFGSLGRLSALSGEVLVDGVQFNHVWSMEDLLGTTQRARNWMSETSGGPRGAEYPPQDFGFRFMSTAVLNNARTAWKSMSELAAAGNTAAARSLQEFSQTLQNAAREVDATWDGVRAFIASRSPDLETRRHSALKTIASTLMQVIERNEVLQAAVAKQREAANAAAAAAANTGAKDQAAATAAAAAAAATKAEESNPYLLPGLVFGGIAVVGVGLYLLRR